MALGGLRLVFDEHFSHQHVEFVFTQSRLCEMRHVRDLGWSGRPDKDWIPLAVRGDYVLVSGDRNDKTRAFTVADLEGMGAKVLLVGGFWDHLNRWERARWLVATIDRIHYVAQGMAAGEVKLLVDRHAKVRDL